MSDAVFPTSRLLAATGATFAAVAVALSAYAAHAAHGEAQSQSFIAAIFLFGHGVALAALAPRAPRRLAQAALAGLAIGTILFSGSLAVRQGFGIATGLAPYGGSLMILSWLLYAADALRRA